MEKWKAKRDAERLQRVVYGKLRNFGECTFDETNKNIKLTSKWMQLKNLYSARINKQLKNYDSMLLQLI